MTANPRLPDEVRGTLITPELAYRNFIYDKSPLNAYTLVLVARAHYRSAKLHPVTYDLYIGLLQDYLESKALDEIVDTVASTVLDL